MTQTKTNILDTFTTMIQYDSGAMKCINTEEIRKAICLNLSDIQASGCSTINKGSFTQGNFTDDEISDMLMFALGGTFGANVIIKNDEFVVTAWND